ncbi:MAG TPA: hypothetical protein VNJ07_04580 [Chitinophagales bacterium]|nr:hypothetical protein [Chitinophagales bacterium]
MPYFIYHLKLIPHYRLESNWKDETREIVTRHFNHLRENCDRGNVLLAGRSALPIEDADNFGICIFEAASLRDAQQFMDNDPALIHGIMTGKVYPFSLAMLRGEEG